VSTRGRGADADDNEGHGSRTGASGSTGGSAVRSEETSGHIAGAAGEATDDSMSGFDPLPQSGFDPLPESGFDPLPQYS